MKQYTKLFYCLFVAVLIMFSAKSQNIIINYDNYSTNQCNAFYPISPTINNVLHTSTGGQPIFDNVNKWVKLDAFANGSNIYSGTEYKVDYNFKQGYSYTITVNAVSKTPTFPEPNCRLRLEFSKASSGGGTSCNGVELLNSNIQQGFNTTNQEIQPSNFFDKTYQFNSLTSAKSSIFIASNLLFINGTASSYVIIKKITITEIPPTAGFTLSPSTLELQKGTSTTQTFTVNNVNNTPNVSGYSWNLGAIPNGWLYNGSAAPSTISTPTNSISLSSVACASVVKNISAAGIINGVSYPTNACNVNLTSPTYFINPINSVYSNTTTNISVNAPASSSVTWTLTYAPQGVTISPTGNPATLTVPSSVTDGNIIFAATITTMCGDVTQTPSKNIYIGIPNFATSYSDGTRNNLYSKEFNPNSPSSINTICQSHFNTPYIDALTDFSNQSVIWSYAPGYPSGDFSFTQFDPTYPNRAKLYIPFGSTTVGYLQGEISNSCGTFSKIFAFKLQYCPPPDRPDPCPTSESFGLIKISTLNSSRSVLLESQNFTYPKDCPSVNYLKNSTNTIVFTDVNIYNKMGSLVKTIHYTSASKAVISLNGLKNDVYIIEVVSKNYVERKKILISN